MKIKTKNRILAIAASVTCLSSAILGTVYTSYAVGDLDKISIINPVRIANNSYSINSNIVYQVKINFESPATILDSDYVYLFVKVAVDKNDPAKDLYYAQQITMDEGKSLNVKIQDATTAKWMDNNGNLATGRQFDGTGVVTAQLYQAVRDVNMNNLIAGTNCTVISEKDSFKNYTVAYADIDKDYHPEDKVTIYNDHIILNTIDASHDYDFKTILRDGLYYGITADRFEQTNHAQTNIAVNYYDSNGKPIEADLSGSFGGHDYIPYFVDLTDHHTIDSNTTFYSADSNEADAKIFIGESHCDNGLVLHVDSKNRIKDKRDFVEFSIENPRNMSDNIIEPIIGDMEMMSEELLENDTIVTALQIDDNTYILDVSAFENRDTLYVDGDDLAKMMNNNIDNKLTIKKNKRQMIVFNFDEITNVKIGTVHVQILDDNYNIIDDSNNYGASSTERGSETNKWLDTLTKYMVWNLNSVTDLELQAASGIFMLPLSTSETTVTGTSNGWIISDGYITNPSGEWHFIYSDLEKDPEPIVTTTTSITTTSTTTTTSITTTEPTTTSTTTTTKPTTTTSTTTNTTTTKPTTTTSTTTTTTTEPTTTSTTTTSTTTSTTTTTKPTTTTTTSTTSTSTTSTTTTTRPIIVAPGEDSRTTTATTTTTTAEPTTTSTTTTNKPVTSTTTVTEPVITTTTITKPIAASTSATKLTATSTTATTTANTKPVENNTPKTGDNGITGAVLALFGSITTMCILRRKKN